ncbi:MAG TPA: DMT family transporter [Magnetospirillaceae bacterium]
MTERRTQLDALAMGLMILFCAIWGFNQVVVKIANASISPLLQAGIRSAGAAILLWIWCGVRGVPLFARDGSFRAGILAGLLFAAEFGLIFYGLQFTTASRGVLFLYTSPFIVAGGLHWLVPAERLRLPQVLGLVCAFVGVFAAFAEGARATGDRQWAGDLLMLAAAAVWGATTVVVRASALIRISASKTLFYQLVVSAITLTLTAWAVGEPGFTNPTPVGLGLLVWQIVVVAFASYLGWFWLIGHYPATRLAAFSFLSPLFGMIFGAVVLGETVTPILVVALVLVAAGLWLVNRRPRIAV